MRRLLAFLASLLLLVGCEELLPKEKPVITLDPDQSTSVTVDAEGGSFDVHFTSALPWSVEIVYSGGSDGWAGISKGSGEGGYAIEKVQVIVQKNESDVQRSAKLVIKSDTVTEEVSFTQSAATTDPGHGQDPEPAVFKLTEGSAEVGAEGGKVQVTVQYNVEYECTVPVDWIREVETKSYDEKVHTFEIDANTLAESRTATISFCGNETCIPFVITQAAAEPEPEPDPVFELSKNAAEVDAEGGTAEVTVTANVEYEYTIPVDWITEVTTRTATDSTHVFDVAPNLGTEPRTATISFCGNGTCIPFTVTQAAAEPEPEPDPVFNLSDGSAEVGAEGGKVQVTVQYNVEYECTVPVDWIREVETKSYDEKVHTFEIDANTLAESRTATISFCGNETCIPFVITQEAAEPEPEPEPVFELSKNSADVVAEGGTIDVTVTSNVEYDYTIPVDWITEVVTKTATECTHTFTVAANTSTEPRTATISFCGNDTCIPFTISQAAAEPERYLNVDKISVSVPAEGTASPVSVNVTSNVAWTVTSDSDWTSVSIASGENDGSFSITVAENTSADSRLATISVVSSSGSLSKTISVIQAPVAQEDGDDAWKTAGFYHRSLAFRFTADWCGFCPRMARSISNANKELAGRLEVVSVHSGGSSLANDASNALASAYPITGFPTGLIDGRTYIENYDIATTTANIVAAVKDTEDTYDVVTGTSWTSAVSGNQVTLNLSAFIKRSGSYKITALLVEDKVISRQVDYDEGDSESYEHNGIIRASFSDVTGESFDVAEDGQIKTFAYSATLPSSCNVNNVRVVAYIQRLDTSNNSYYVDNAATAKVGMAKALGINSENWSGGNEGIVPGDDITL